MATRKVFAQIYNRYVKNVIVCEDYEMANYIARATYGNNAFAVECTQYRCDIDDLYYNNQFWKVKDGVESVIEPEPTEEQQIQLLTQQLSLANETITNLELAMVEMYEGMV